MEIQKRKTIRSKDFDYNSEGVYFITICTQNKQCLLSRFVSTFKRFCNKEYGKNIWQARSYDHVIRDYNDYEKHINYIIENPNRWFYDDLYYE